VHQFEICSSLNTLALAAFVCLNSTMPKRLSKKRKEDSSQAAFRTVQRLIERTTETETPKPVPHNVVPIRHRKNPAAVALGKKGGLKSAQGRMEKIAPEERRRIASAAARTRWAKENGGG
jgi:hypothetical protein